MLQKRTFVIVGIAFLVFGMIFILTGAQSMTGMVVMENVDLELGSVTGLWLVAAGLVILLVRKEVR